MTSPQTSKPIEAATTTTLLNLRIRFSHSAIPDIPLALPFPPPLWPSEPPQNNATYSVNNLKGRIRTALPEEWGKHGLKLIYGGRVLDGRHDVLSALRVTLPEPPRRTNTHSYASDTNLQEQGDDVYSSAGKGDWKGKGKERATNGNMTDSAPAVSMPPIYIHCAITPTALESRALQQQLKLEAEPATRAAPGSAPAFVPSALTRVGFPVVSAAATAVSSSSSPPSPPTASQDQQQPIGFDRLLAPASGFSTSDVNALRDQFRRIISNRYTPDTMPSAPTLRRMEEAWLDDSSSLPTGTAAGTARRSEQRGGDEATGGPAGQSADGDGAGSGGYNDDDASAALDDTFYGVFMGFFWPLGACVWGLREEGIWSRRRGWAVLAGVMVNIGFGVVRVLS